MSRDKLAQDYARQFNQDLSNELDIWINQQLKENVLKNPLEYLDKTIQLELETINSEFQDLNLFSESESSQWQFISQNQADLISKSGFWGGFGAIGVGAVLIPVVFMAGSILGIIAGLGAGLFGGGGIAIIEDSLRDKVIQSGCDQFDNSLDEIFDNLNQMIISVFTERVQIASKAIEKAISIYENLLEQQEKVHQSTLEEREKHKAWILSKHQQIKKLSDAVEVTFTTT